MPPKDVNHRTNCHNELTMDDSSGSNRFDTSSCVFPYTKIMLAQRKNRPDHLVSRLHPGSLAWPITVLIKADLHSTILKSVRISTSEKPARFPRDQPDSFATRHIRTCDAGVVFLNNASSITRARIESRFDSTYWFYDIYLATPLKMHKLRKFGIFYI